MKVVMVVNNPATTDYRVVKSAEMVANFGFDCHVVGILKPDFPEKEYINGVTYHRVKLRTGLRPFLFGLHPNIGLKFLAYRKNTYTPKSHIQEKRAIEKNNTPSFLQKAVNVLKSIIRRVGNKTKTTIKKPLNKLHPRSSPLGVMYLQGRYLLSFYPALCKLDADIYHAHELWTLESCALVAKNKNRKLTYDSHEIESHRNNDWSHSSNKKRKSYEKKYIHQASAIYTVSKGCASIIKNEFNIEKIYILRNTPLIKNLKETKVNLRKKFSIPDNEKVIIYTGLITTNRGLELVLESLPKLKQFHLVAIGPANEILLGKLHATAKSLGVKERFHIHEKVPPSELIHLSSQGDLAVLPIKNACLSYQHCLPNKLFEAAFANLPIVSADLPDIKEFLDKYNIGTIFKPYDSMSFAAAVKAIEKRGFQRLPAQELKNLMYENSFEEEAKILKESFERITTIEA